MKFQLKKHAIGIALFGLLASSKLLAQCQGFAVDITSNPPPPHNLCPGETITLISNLTGGTPPFTYLWSNGDITPNTVITPPAYGSEMLAVTDDNGCLAENSFHLKAPVWTVDIFFNGWTYCVGDSMPLYAYPDFPAGTNFLWSTGATTSSIYITNPGTYSLTATSPSGQCSATATEFVQVSYFPMPNPNITGTTMLCPGQNGTLTASGASGDAFAWSTGDVTSSITITSPGTYSVTVTNDSGCTGTDSQVVTSGGLPPILNNPTPICPGQSTTVEVTNASAFTGFLWSTGGTGSSITITSAGTYTVTVTVSGGCTATGSATVVTGSSNINITGTTTPVTFCTAPNGAVNITVSPTGAYEFDWSNGPISEDLANIAAGSYTVTVTDNGGCTATAGFAVVNNTAPPVLTATATPDTCGQNIGSVNQSVSPTGAYTYGWSNGATTEDLANIAAGSYTVTTTSTTTGCTATASANVTNTTINPTVTGVITQPSGGQNNGAISITVSPTGSYTFNWSNGATTEDLAGLGEGNYAVTVSAGGSCTATASFVLVAVGCTMTVSISVDAPNPGVVCVGDNITITANVTGGTAPYTYDWSNGITTQSFTVAAPYNQTLVLGVTDDDGCTALATIHIKVNVWYVDINYSQFPTCLGDTLALIASTTAEIPGTTYTWSTGETGFMINVTSSGTYSVSMTNPNVNCTANATVTVTVGTVPAPNPQIVGPTTLCTGQSANLSVNGGPFSTYAWSDGSSDPTLTITDPGGYFVTVTNALGCTGEDFIDIQAGGTPPSLNDPTPICPGQNTTVEVTNAAEFTGFLWSNGGTGSSISVTTPGTYSVTVTAAGGCTAVGSADVLQISSNLNITGTVTSVTSCTTSNGGVNVTVSPTGTYDFNWSNGPITEDIANVAAGSYTLTVTEASGCTSSQSFAVVENVILPSLSTIITPATCGQNNGAVDLSVSPTGSYMFLWPTGASTEDLANIAAGSYTVTVTATATGCTATASAIVQSSGSNIGITGNATPLTSCTAPNGAIDITASPAGAYTFVWSSGASTEDLSNLAAGSYTVTVSAGGNCTASASFTVPNNITVPASSVVATPATCGQSNGGIDITISPSGTYVFNWSNGASTEDLLNLAAGNYDVTVTSSTTGCTATTSATVQDNGFTPNITGTASPNTSCTASNGSINTNVSPSGSYDISWSNGGNTQHLTGLAAGTYTVTVTAGGNCTNSASFIVEQNASLPSLSANVTPAVCGDPIGAIDLSVAPVGNYVFSWSNGASTEDLTGLSPGNYTVIATVTVTGCTAIATFNVPNNSSNFTLTGSSTPVTNCGAPNGNIDLSISPSGAYGFLWSNGDTTEDLQNLAVGNYTVTVTQAGACTGEASFQVIAQVVQPLLAQNASPASCGQPNGSVDLSVTPASGNSFSWSNGAGSEDLQNVPSGSYSVTVTSANGCTATTSATVLENSTAITLTGSATANTSCTGANGSVDLTASPAGAYNFVWSNGTNSEDLQNLAGGSYAVTVSAGGNCTTTGVFTVPNNSGAPDLTTTTNPATCGQNNGSIDLTASPSGAYTFTWSNGANTEDLQNVAPGNFIVTCTGANGCPATTSVTIPNNNTNFTLTTAATPSASCTAATGEINLTISPSGNYVSIWSNGEAMEDLQNIAAGNYSVTVTDANGCSDIGFVTVGGPTALQVAVVGPNAACAGASVSLSASAGFVNYLWSNGAVGNSITVSQTGTYSVTTTDANGCTAMASQPFSNFPLPNLSISGPASICGGSTQFMVSGGVFSQINWSTGETGQSITVSQSGNYIVTVTDGNGCTATDSQGLSIGTSLQSSIAPASSCNGTAILDAGQGYATYLWSNGGNSQVLSVSANGTYTVTVSDGTGCTGETSAQVIIPTPPQVAITGANSICQGGSTQFSVPNNFTQINWSTGAVTPSVTVSLPAIYSVTVSDANGCTASASQTLTVGAGLTPDITATLTDCNGSTSLDAGLGYASYLWSNGSTLQNIMASANGIFTVTVSDASGCSGTASETVTIPTPPQVQVVGASQICEGDATVLAAPGNFTQYLWSTGEATPQITVMQGGTYAVTVSDANGCTASDSWVVAQLLADFTLLETTACSSLDTGTVTTLLTNQYGCDSVVMLATVLVQPIFTQIELEVCEGESAVFNGVAIPAGSSQDFVFAAANGCDSMVLVSVVAFPAVSFELEASVACQDLPNGSIAVLMLGGEQPYQFSLNGGVFQSDTLFAGLLSGSYIVTAKDGNGCIFPENVSIPAIPPMVVEVADETMVCGETVLLKPLVISSLAVDWQWSDSSGVVSTADRLLVNSPGTYFFTVMNACESFSGEIKVEVEPLKQATLIYLPNSFSPNGDGLNDCYQGYIDPKVEIMSYELKIFDRWGDQIFDTTDVDGCWDGWYRGKEMDPAVMVYWVRMHVRNCDGLIVEVFRKGDVHLVR